MPKSRKGGIALALLFVLVATSVRSSPGGDGISQNEYQSRRAKLISVMDTSEVIVMKAADSRLRSNDVNYRYRQESNFLYITGLNSPGHFVLIVPRGVTVDGVVAKAVLFIAGSTDDLEKPVAGFQEIGRAHV
jgi:hypothetical protein